MVNNTAIMKVCYLLITLLTFYMTDFVKCADFQSTLGHIRPQRNADIQANAVRDLITRLLTLEQASKFSVKIDESLQSDDGLDAFSIEKLPDGIVEITGNTGVAAASALNYYLKYYCHSHVSWESLQLNLPDPLPDVNVTVTFNDRFRYYQNVCTSSYSFVWWSWSQWEKHIDWIVLNSFNLVLAFNGQEAIWNRVYTKFDLTQNDVDDYFSGPAFLAWLRMGNIQTWAGPLSSAWNTRSLILQKLIVERMRNFGIITVLPAYAGFVPRAFRSIYPDVNMTQSSPWNGFNTTYSSPYFVDPTQTLFNELGKAFMEEQIAEFGTDHIYNCDSFNENDPISSDLTYLANVGQSIYAAMTDADPDAIWLIQNWFIVHNIFYWTREKAKAFLTAVPKGKMIVLDLQSELFPQYERLDQYYGQPYIWCMLHNFGGVLGMYGMSDSVNENAIRARHLENSTMIGTGLTPEGINQNYVIYDLMSESAWRTEPANLTEWFGNYATRRYGSENDNATEAWQLLYKTVYGYKESNKNHGRYVITDRPSLNLSPWSWYALSDLLEAWDFLLEASDVFQDNAGYLYDLVDVTRQVLQVYGDIYYPELIDAYNRNNTEAFNDRAIIFLDVFNDLESILATNEGFLLGIWVKTAKDAANNTDDKLLFEYNARNQITLWGPRGEIVDYANKQWSGVVSNYTGARWSLFVDYLNETLSSSQEFDENYIKQKMFDEVEKPFTFDTTELPVKPIGDTIEIARQIYEKWYSRPDLDADSLRQPYGTPHDDENDMYYNYFGRNRRPTPTVHYV